MRLFGLGAERSRLLMRTVRACWESEHAVPGNDRDDAARVEWLDQRNEGNESR